MHRKRQLHVRGNFVDSHWLRVRPYKAFLSHRVTYAPIHYFVIPAGQLETFSVLFGLCASLKAHYVVN